MSGHHFLFVPGPSNVPSAVQQAIHCPMEDHRNPTIPDLIQPITQDLKKLLRTETGKVVFKDPDSSKNPNVSQLLITRAKEIYAFYEEKENGQS